MKLWYCGLILVLGTAIYQWLDTPLPHDMEDKWKIRLSEAVMRSGGNLVSHVVVHFIVCIEHYS